MLSNQLYYTYNPYIQYKNSIQTLCKSSSNQDSKDHHKQQHHQKIEQKDVQKDNEQLSSTQKIEQLNHQIYSSITLDALILKTKLHYDYK